MQIFRSAARFATRAAPERLASVDLGKVNWRSLPVGPQFNFQLIDRGLRARMQIDFIQPACRAKLT
jgi:hypothetical protein